MVKMDKYCVICGEQLKGRQELYCSVKCKRKKYYLNNKKKINKKNLENYHKKYKYTRKYNYNKKNKNCIICGKPLPKKRRSYCSDKCQIIGKNRCKTRDIYREDRVMPQNIPIYCEECGGRVIQSEGDIFCKKCGLMVE